MQTDLTEFIIVSVVMIAYLAVLALANRKRAAEE